jgi:hypothetical protein
MKTLRAGGSLNNDGRRIWISGTGIKASVDDLNRRRPGRGVAQRTLKALERKGLVKLDKIEIGIPAQYAETPVQM